MVDRKKTAKPRTPKINNRESDCVIPPALPPEVLGDFVLNAGGKESDQIRSYVEWQAPDETVLHLEKVASENIFGQPMDGWDVQTDKDRWWVITHPTNLYSQTLFPSLDYTFSFHVGIHTRMMQAEMCQEQEEAHDRINQLWNKLARANATLFKASKVEDFQSVGMKCRECLLLLADSLAQPQMVPSGTESPKRGDFIHWCELIANYIAAGSSNESVRTYLKQVSKSTWQLVNWLTHSHHAAKFDGAIATEATENVMETFMVAWARFEAPKQEEKRKARGRKPKSK
jgi:hypothetical protein